MFKKQLQWTLSIIKKDGSESSKILSNQWELMYHWKWFPTSTPFTPVWVMFAINYSATLGNHVSFTQVKQKKLYIQGQLWTKVPGLFTFSVISAGEFFKGNKCNY